MSRARSSIDRLGARGPASGFSTVPRATAFAAAGAAGRTFKAAKRNGRPARLKPAAAGGGLFDLTPDRRAADAAGDRALPSQPSSCARRRPAADAACATPARGARPGERARRDAARRARRARRGGQRAVRPSPRVLVGRGAGPRRHGPRGRRAGAGRGGDARSACGATRDQQATYLPAFVATMSPRPRSRCRSRARCSTRSHLRTLRGATAATIVLDGVKSLVPRADAGRAVRRRGRARGTRPRAVPRGVRRPRACSQARPRRWACAPRLRARCCSRMSACPPRRCSAAATPPCTRSASACAPCLVCACVGTAQAVLDYVIPVRQRARGLRRTDQPPPGRRLRGRGHRDRAGRDAPGRPTARRRPRRAGQGLRPRGRAGAAAVRQKGMRIGREGVQLLGGHGYVKEHPVERWYRDLRAVGRDGGRWCSSLETKEAP